MQTLCQLSATAYARVFAWVCAYVHNAFSIHKQIPNNVLTKTST